MKNKTLFILLGTGVVLLAIGYVIGRYGTLTGNMLICGGGIIIGVALLISLIREMFSEKGKRANKVATLIVALAIAFVSGKNFIASVMDLSAGTEEMILYDCNVSERSGRKLMIRNQYISGYDEAGDKQKFLINKKIYNKYKYESDMTFTVVYWEKSGIIKELVD